MKSWIAFQTINRYLRVFVLSAFVLLCENSHAQSLPVGTPVLEEYLRRLQVMGTGQVQGSLMIRPLHATTAQKFDSLWFPALDSGQSGINKTALKRWRRMEFGLMPLQLRQQINTHHPYGWNDGAIIPAKGYQVKASGGVYARLGKLSVQLQPEVVWAANNSYPGFPAAYSDQAWLTYAAMQNQVDDPPQFGSKPYRVVLPGQSSVRFNHKKLSIGISTENLWWGPGMRNSLIMSNSAPGFPHLTFNTTAPVTTPIGKFEWQLIGGQLVGSGFLPFDTSRKVDGNSLFIGKPNSRRYINALTISWQPKWIANVYLGFSRASYQYQDSLRFTLNGLLPVFGFKDKNAAESTYGRDQMFSLSFRWLLPASRAEVYGEWGRNDYALNFRDVVLEPEHARAHILGAQKYFNNKKGRLMSWFVEITQTQMSSTFLYRGVSYWYTHGQVWHGYTNRGQVMGAAIGTGGSNMQSLGINWYKGVRKTTVSLDRIVRANDFFYTAFAEQRNFMRHWVDLSLNAERQWTHKRFVFSANASLVRSLNYQWRQKNLYGPKDVFNLHAAFTTGYRF